MTQLTDIQKEFILEHFFKLNSYKGWKPIATTLLERGVCVVGNKETIWVGNIGHFIKVQYDLSDYELFKDSPLLNAVDCCVYTFDLDAFLSSDYFKHIKDDYLHKLDNQIEESNIRYKEIAKIVFG